MEIKEMNKVYNKTDVKPLIGVGVGPGDPEQITLKAYQTIKDSDVIFLPNAPKEDSYAYMIAKQAVEHIDDKVIVPLHFPMIRDKAAMHAALDDIYMTMRQYLFSGKKCVFLTIGDPTVYSTFQYMKKRFEAEDQKTDTVNGITSFTAAAAALGISLGDGSEEIHIIPAKTDDLTALSFPGTKVFMKSGKRLGKLLEILKARNCYEVYGVSNCGMPGEQLYRSIEEVDPNAGYLTVLIVKDKAGESDKEKNSFYYYENRECKYYPCHNGEHLNCMFCYCPLYHMVDCPGEYFMKEIRGKEVKVCTNCLFPHKKENYKEVVARLRP